MMTQTVMAMVISLSLLLVTLLILVSICGVKAESPLVNTLATGAVGMAGAIAGLSMPNSRDKPEAKQ